jgi:hypothetical protein
MGRTAIPASVLMCMSGNMACAAAPTSTAPLWCSREHETEGNVSSDAAASAPKVASGISSATWRSTTSQTWQTHCNIYASKTKPWGFCIQPHFAVKLEDPCTIWGLWHGMQRRVPVACEV